MTDSLLPNIVERSYQLARSGACSGIEEVRRSLQKEGYTNVAAHLSAAPSLRKDLSMLCLQATRRFDSVQAGRLNGLQSRPEGQTSSDPGSSNMSRHPAKILATK